VQAVGVGPRAVAAVIDIVVLTLISCCILVMMLSFGVTDLDTEADASAAFDDVPAWINLMGLGVGLVYFIVMEGLTGTTLGKRLLKLRVVRFDGSPITMKDSVVRNIFRILDGLFLYLIAAVAVWTSNHNQRFGDRVAGTLVINDTGHGGGPAPEQPF
jgi:uncharacterized RDD family membrane protein YckC